MKAIKLLVVCSVVTVVMAASWVIGTLIGNAITGSVPPPPPESSHAGLLFLAVCAFNSILITTLLALTDSYTGARRRIALIIYVFGVQCLLPQMETFFFASQIGIGYDQTTAIMIAGAVVSCITIMISMILYKKLIGATPPGETLSISFSIEKTTIVPLLFLIVVAYPFLYLAFGYYVAWQNEALRIFYTSSAAKASFTYQIGEAFTNGIYFFQILRGLIWIVLTIPLVIMFKANAKIQFLAVGVLSALLPTSLLFIPNPYMPWDIAMTHFVETSTSNFVWGLLIVWAIKKGLDNSQQPAIQ